MKKKLLIPIVAAALAYAAFRVYSSRTADGKTVFSGTVEMTEHNVGPAASGTLARLLVDEYDPVTKGQVLGWLERYDKTKRDYERNAALLKEGGATEQQVEDSELAMEDQRIVSPVDGFVLTRVHDMGEVIPAGGAVLDLGDANDIWVRIYVPEGEINGIRVGQAAQVRLDGVAAPLTGRVSFVAPQAEFTPRNVQTTEERVQQSFAVKVKLLAPPESVRPGVAADVELKP